MDQILDLELESMYFNSVWDLVDQPDGVKFIGCKWIYKRKRVEDDKVQTFKARLVAKGYTQVEGVDYEETFLPVAKLKSIRILLFIDPYYDYEKWKMDVKTAFFNGNLEETIYMQKLKGFITSYQEQKIFKDRKNKTLVLSQASYIDKIVVKYSMQNSKRGLLPCRHGVTLSKEQCPKTPQEVEEMRHIPYASVVGSLMYAMLCTRLDICSAVGIVSRYQSSPKYLRRTRDYMLMLKLSSPFKELAFQPKLFKNVLAIYTPVGDVLLNNEVLRNCEVLVEGLSILVNLLPLELQMLDVNLGMNFFYTHYVSMDCHKKEMVFRKLGLPPDKEVEFTIELLP
ncbi:retrotransposon protein, putative, Ty1-copia subclass [Cucumis melo var. makuwa]|uniref:Retrotransposon protein, putative, Ty1-copia subclass n=1 Tax=Cucumis melo var. makuwa TaxID=1194695 RepID=A0A5D3DCU8_CUCMM|nr:retrotransposon protein, putative, Ty1-copia subclass [Cucumis melo var. makuwa]TYK21393.1 retrotransposon protein, putative, Ty1-copia subclass [Cucumis melo var. makuwa]